MNKIGLFLTIALAPVCAFAVDGVTLINQSTVMAAGGFPYTIATSGSYRLSGNLVVSTCANGIQVTTSFVTLDLNGFTIQGPGGAPCTSAGVSVFGSSQGFMLKNGAITNFLVGVAVAAGPAIITNIQASGNGDGIVGEVVVIVGCAANSSTSTGFQVIQSTVSDSTANANGLDGFSVTDSILVHNVANNNSAFGIIGIQGFPSVFSRNITRNNLHDFSILGSLSGNDNLATGQVVW